MKKISIVIATYNGSKHINEQLTSILDQTYNNFDIVIIDDCSHDGTIEAVKQIFKKAGFSNYKILINKENIGPTKSFEKGIEKSSGEYIAICDQDDIWFSRKLEVSLNAIEEHDSDLAYSDSLIMKDSIKTSSIFPAPRETKKFISLFMHNEARGATLLIKRSFLLKILPFPDYGIYDKWIYILGNIYGKAIHIERPMHYYRFHQENFHGGSFKRRSKDDLLNKLSQEILFYKKLLNFVQNNQEINSSLSYDYTLGVIKDVISFHNDTYTCVKKKNLIKCVSKYIHHVCKNEFNTIEKLIYFYYFFLKF